jgi:DNA-binding transcriptional MerR regulator/methylmalonyl-CoA mutase cobalamin-binding subunit
MSTDLPNTLPIAAVERATRLSRDVLRTWEKRYGFPVSQRDANGERCYPSEQVERLRLMKGLIDQGYRPGSLTRLSAGELAALPPRRTDPDAQDAAPEAAPEADVGDAALEGLLATIRHDPAGFGHAIRHELARQGLERFVQNVSAPLTCAVGQRWASGSFGVHNEHLYTEETARVLRQGIAALPRTGQAPRILLTTLSGENHGLGLLMAEALLALDGADCISLGTGTPLSDIVRAAAAHACDIVALSFSSNFPQRQIGPALRKLRLALGGHIALWAGGAGIAELAPIQRVLLLPTLESGRQALAGWRDGHKAPPRE